MGTSSRRLDPPEQGGKAVQISIDGRPLTAYEGETLAAALLAAGELTLRHTDRQGEPRGVFCGVGLCHECRVTVNGVPNVRACLTIVEPGMLVRRQRGPNEGRRS